MSYTPGPWRSEKRSATGDHVVFGADATPVVDGRIYWAPDLALISAATDLLEALEAVRAEYRRGLAQTHESLKAAWDQADAAIRKARGEASEGRGEGSDG